MAEFLTNQDKRTCYCAEVNEAQIGEKLRVQRAEENGLFYFRTMRSDGKINSEAQIELRDI